jgi:hypothetical protein
MMNARPLFAEIVRAMVDPRTGEISNAETRFEGMAARSGARCAL